MNNVLKYSIAFIAGGFAINMPSVIANIPTAEDALSRTLALAIYNANRLEKEQEEQELAKLPNILDCQRMEWMKNCSEINKQAKKNPNAPIKILNKQGLEFNFAPGTPSAMIRLQLELTPEAAEAALQYQDESWGLNKKAASLYQDAMWRAGPMPNLIGLEQAKKLSDMPKNVDTKTLAISAFVHSQCGACEVQLSTLQKLQSRYPELKITVFQFDNNPSGFKAKVTDKGLAGRMLNRQEAEAALKNGVERWPTLWIDNYRVKERNKLSGTRSIFQLEEELQAMTYVKTAAK